MRERLREQLQTACYVADAAELAIMARKSRRCSPSRTMRRPAQLRAHADKLKQIEDSLESA